MPFANTISVCSIDRCAIYQCYLYLVVACALYQSLRCVGLLVSSSSLLSLIIAWGIARFARALFSPLFPPLSFFLSPARSMVASDFGSLFNWLLK